MANIGLTLVWQNGIKTVISFCPPNQTRKYILMTSFVTFVHASFKQLDINAYISYFKFQIMKFSIHCRYKPMTQFSETCKHLHPFALLTRDNNSEHALTTYLIYHTWELKTKINSSSLNYYKWKWSLCSTSNILNSAD